MKERRNGKIEKKPATSGILTDELLIGRLWYHSNHAAPTLTRTFFGYVAVHLSKRHFLNATLDISIERKSGAPRFEPGAAG